MKGIKAIVAASCLLAATAAQAGGVIVYDPILIGPGARGAFNIFLNVLADSGATPCDPDIHTVCKGIRSSFATAKRGRSNFLVVTIGRL